MCGPNGPHPWSSTGRFVQSSESGWRGWRAVSPRRRQPPARRLARQGRGVRDARGWPVASNVARLEPRAKSQEPRATSQELVPSPEPNGACLRADRTTRRPPAGGAMDAAETRRRQCAVRASRVECRGARSGPGRGEGGARSGRPRADRPLRGERPCQPDRRKRRPSAGGRSMRPRRSAGDVQSGRTVPGVVRRAELHGRCPSKSVLCPRWALQGCPSTGLRGSSSSRADPRRRLRPFASPEPGTAPSRRDRLRTSGRSCHCVCDRRGGGPGRG